MKHCKKKPENIIEILIQPQYLNKYISINHDHIYDINHESKGITYLKDRYIKQ